MHATRSGPGFTIDPTVAVIALIGSPSGVLSIMSLRVLIADPDVPLLASYREVLSREGFEVATATNGLDCVAELRSFRPDVLVLEPDLPWGWGAGVLAAMREEYDVPLVPVLVLSARHDPESLFRVAALPIHEVQVKPLAPLLLAQRIRHLVENVAAPGCDH
jgi:DNA-binding response OmpR family regulator